MLFLIPSFKRGLFPDIMHLSKHSVCCVCLLLIFAGISNFMNFFWQICEQNYFLAWTIRKLIWQHWVGREGAPPARLLHFCLRRCLSENGGSLSLMWLASHPTFTYLRDQCMILWLEWLQTVMFWKVHVCHALVLCLHLFHREGRCSVMSRSLHVPNY